MSNHHVKYLLIGGGVASSAAAGAIRGRDAEGPILMVGQEISRPYHRPPLSKELLRREIGREQLFTREASWFDENRVELRTGQRASHLDVSRRMVTLDNGEEISFDRLLLATGGVAAPLKVPGADLPNLFYLRTIEDMERLHRAVEKARTEGRPHLRGRGRAVVIGGGLLGVEAAASLTQLGVEAELIVDAAHPWSRIAGEQTGMFLARFLEKNGVTVHLKQRAEALAGEGRVQRVLVTGGDEIACDFAVAAVGLVINKELLRGTPIVAGKAILVDDHCRTNIPEIFAAGDCAAVFDPLFGKHRLMDHWDNARQTGALAGRNMAGADERYDHVNWYFSEVFGLRASFWGEPRLVDRRVVRGNARLEQTDFIEIGIAADGRVAQIIAVGHPREDEVLLRGIVGRRARITGIEEQLKDPSYDLRHVP